jgi:hypothetical protein
MSDEAAWLARRLRSFGASEMGALWIALEWATPDQRESAPKYMLDNARRLFEIKAGLRRSGSAGRVAARGASVERRLLAAWLGDEGVRCPVRAEVASACHADGVPRGWFPLVDRDCPRLTATPDAWGTDILDAEIVIEIKSTARACIEPPWYWLLQVQAQLAVTGAAWGALVIGEWWAADWREPGPISAYWVPRNEAQIAQIRAAVALGWERVERLRDASNEEQEVSNGK